MEKKPLGGSTSQPAFERGAPLSPASGLLTWIESQKRGSEPRLLRLPVVMPRAQVGYGMRGATVGSGGDALTVNLDDSALGIGLGQKARKCKGERCPFLVEGYWQGKQGDGYTFKVVKAGNPLTDEELAAITHAEVEGPSGN